MIRMIIVTLMLVVMAAPAWADDSTSCDIGERSVRGYCPDDPGHDEERRSLFEDDEEHPGPVLPDDEPEYYSEPELPRTGVDPLVLLVVAVALLGTGGALLHLPVRDGGAGRGI